VAREIKMLAAKGAFAPRAYEQVALLVWLSDDPDAEIAAATEATVAALPLVPLRGFLARSDVTNEIRQFFAARGVEPAEAPPEQAETDAPIVDTLTDVPEAVDGKEAESEEGTRLLSSLPVLERMKLAMKGTREQRSVLVRDSNKLVAAAVLSSPKLTESEVEAFTKMGNVTEDVLRIIGQNRSWLKNYGIAVGLCRHPKTPPALSMHLVNRLNERDLKMLAIDRNVPEGLRVLARKALTKTKYG
jgi:hypothetical protein